MDGDKKLNSIMKHEEPSKFKPDKRLVWFEFKDSLNLDIKLKIMP